MKRWIKQRIPPAAGSDGGKKRVAATQFGLLLPIFALGYLAMFDVGLAIKERMTIDRTLVSGADVSRTSVEESPVIEDKVRSIGDHRSGNAAMIGSVEYSLSLNKTCECLGTASSCNALCAGNKSPSVFLDLSSSRTMRPLTLPAFDLSSSLRIQIR